MTVAAPKTFF